MSTGIPDLERVVFFNGQQLEARDFAALQRSAREFRWLHNRALHSWGIAFGYDVAGERGDSFVTVKPGYGTDCLGREIILEEERQITVPAVAVKSEFFLTASYLGDAGQHVAERRAGVCHSGGAVRLTEEPLLEWRTSKDIPPVRDVPLLILAHATIENCRLSLSLDLRVRRFARGSQGPYIAAGQTVAGGTAWQPLTMAGQTIGVQTAVNTSAARFHATPAYVAHVEGERFLAAGPLSQSLVALGFTSVAAATPESFTLQVLLPRFPAGAPPVNPAELGDPTKLAAICNAMRWQVVWMGIEA
jgi:hypothetical protein